MNFAPVKAYLAEIDEIIVEARRDHGLRTPCLKGCCACCSEPLITWEAEARYILDSLPAEQVSQLEGAVRWWAIQVAPVIEIEKLDLMAYRRLMAPCPLLGPDGLCRCYKRRPMACRTFFAVSHPERCAIEHRADQLFIVFGQLTFYSANLKLLEVSGEVTVDHLTAHFHRILTGPIKSGQMQHITTKQTKLWKTKAQT